MTALHRSGAIPCTILRLPYYIALLLLAGVVEGSRVHHSLLRVFACTHQGRRINQMILSESRAADCPRAKRSNEIAALEIK